MLPTAASGRPRRGLAPYENCPLQFFFGSLLELGAPVGRRDAASAAIFHDVLEAFHDPERNEPQTLERLLELAERAVASERRSSPRAARSASSGACSTGMLARLLRLRGRARPRRRGARGRAALPASSSTPRRSRGYIDRIDRLRRTARLRLVDYKTVEDGDEARTRPSRTSSSPSTRSPAATVPELRALGEVSRARLPLPARPRARARRTRAARRSRRPRRADARAHPRARRRDRRRAVRLLAARPTARGASSSRSARATTARTCRCERSPPSSARSSTRSAAPLRIAAGAGTGKTDTLRRAIVELIEGGARPGEILCLTFTVEATEGDAPPRPRRVRRPHGHRPRRAHRPDLPRVRRLDRPRARAARSGSTATPALLDQRAPVAAHRSRRSTRCASTDLEIGWLPTLRRASCSTCTRRCSGTSSRSTQVRRLVPRARAATTSSRDRARGASARSSAYAERSSASGTRSTSATRSRSPSSCCARGPRCSSGCARASATSSSTSTRTPTSPSASWSSSSAPAPSSSARSATWTRASSAGAARRSTTCSRSRDDFPGARIETLSVELPLRQADPRPRERDHRRVRRRRAGYEREAARAAAPTRRRRRSRRSSRRTSSTRPRRSPSGSPRPARRGSQYAVLVRKRSQFDPIFRALTAARGAGRGRHARRLLDAPGDPRRRRLAARCSPTRATTSRSAGILLGPAYRLGRRDLFFLADHAKDEQRAQRRRRCGDRDVLPYALVDSIVAHEADRRALGRGARARRPASARPGASWPRSPSASRSPTSSARSRASAASPPSSTARRIPRRSSALRHLAKLRDLAQGYQPVAGSADLAGFVALPRLDRGVRPGRGRAARGRGERGPADDDPPREGARVGHRLPPRAGDEHVPDASRRPHDPTTKWQRLPFELRGDRDFVPRRRGSPTATRRSGG